MVGVALYRDGVRYIDGREYATVSEVADAAGVSPQTVRQWEKLGRIVSRRSPGGHRLFDMQAVKSVVDHAARMRREERTPAASLPAQLDVRAAEFAATGARIRAARAKRRLTQEQVATRAGVSRSLLSAVERGESGMSAQVYNRIADALAIPMSDLAQITQMTRSAGAVMRAADRPRTVLAGGSTWEELASSGHSMAPALLLVEPGGASGGSVVSLREHFVTVITGELILDVSPPAERHLLHAGDSVIILPGQAHSWINEGEETMRAVWVEQLKG